MSASCLFNGGFPSQQHQWLLLATLTCAFFDTLLKLLIVPPGVANVLPEGCPQVQEATTALT